MTGLIREKDEINCQTDVDIGNGILTHINWIDFSIIITWTSPFSSLGFLHGIFKFLVNFR